VQQFFSREKHSCHHPTTLLSGPRSEWLLPVPYSENGSQGDTFLNYLGHQIECDARTPEDSKGSLRRWFQQWQDRWSMCAQGSYFEGG
jgi:hypothetical protein